MIGETQAARNRAFVIGPKSRSTLRTMLHLFIRSTIGNHTRQTSYARRRIVLAATFIYRMEESQGVKHVPTRHSAGRFRARALVGIFLCGRRGRRCRVLPHSLVLFFGLRYMSAELPRHFHAARSLLASSRFLKRHRGQDSRMGRRRPPRCRVCRQWPRWHREWTSHPGRSRPRIDDAQQW